MRRVLTDDRNNRFETTTLRWDGIQKSERRDRDGVSKGERKSVSKRVLDVESSFFIFDIISLLLLDDDFDDFDDTTDKHIDDTD